MDRETHREYGRRKRASMTPEQWREFLARRARTQPKGWVDPIVDERHP